MLSLKAPQGTGIRTDKYSVVAVGCGIPASSVTGCMAPWALHLCIMHCFLSLSLNPNPLRKGHISLQPFGFAFIYRLLPLSLVMRKVQTTEGQVLGAWQAQSSASVALQARLDLSLPTALRGSGLLRTPPSPLGRAICTLRSPLS